MHIPKATSDSMDRRAFALRCAISTLAVAGCGLPLSAIAQPSFPARTMSITAPVAAGGLTDLLARLLAVELGKELGTSIIVENRVGAGGTVGMAAVARMEPDGHSMILAFQGPATVAPSLYSGLTYDTLRDFAPVGMVGSFDNSVVVNASAPIRQVNDLIALARQKPGQLDFGSAGVGSTSHLTGELFFRQAGTSAQHVPYKGEALALTDLAAGRVTVVFSTLAAAKPMVDAGKLRVIAVATRERSRFAPSIPTVAESGLRGFEVPGWYGLLVPIKTPAASVRRLAEALDKVRRDPSFIAKAAEIGLEPSTMPRAAFADWLKADAQRWKSLIKETGIQAQ